LLPIADQVRRRSLFHGDAWANLAGHTEAAWTDYATAGDWPTWKRHDGEVLELVCRANLDVHLGTAGRYGRRLGKLGTEGARTVFGRGLAHGAGPADALWFGLTAAGSCRARRPTRRPGRQGIHFSADSVRNLWLDRERRPQPAVTRG
jgi:hypothetical protein